MSRRATEWLLTAGVIGPFLFVLAFTVIGAVRSDYNPVRMFVSWLSLEEGAWAEIANLIVFGVLTVGGALGLRRAMRVGRGARLGPILIGLAGVALVVTGAFVPDPSNLYPPDGPGKPKFASISALLHDGAAGVVFFSLALAMLVVARRFAAERSWWALYSRLSAAGTVGFLVASLTIHRVAGVLERIAILIMVGWVALVMWRFRRVVAREA